MSHSEPVYIPSKNHKYTHSCVSRLERVVRRVVIMVQRGCGQFWTFFWLAGGKVSGSQHHQPACSNKSGVSMLVGSRELTSPTWWGVQCLHSSSKVLLCLLSLEGNQDLSRDFTIVSWLLLPCLCIPSLSWLAIVWTCLLELREGPGGWMNTISCNQENGGHWKTLCPGSHRVLHGFSIAVVSEWVNE